MGRAEAIKTAKRDATTRSLKSYNYVDEAVLERLGISQYKAKDGDNFLYIVPPQDPEAYFAREIWKHSNIGVDGITFLCPQKMWGKRCPICEDILKLKKEDGQEDLIKELRPNQRYLFFVVDVASSDAERKGVQWYDAPIGVNDGIVKLSVDKRTGAIVDVSDPEQGFNVLFEKTGKNKMTRYGAFELEARKRPAKKDWLDVPDFEKVLKVAEYDIISSVYRGMGAASSSEEAADVTEVSTERRQRARTAESESTAVEPEREDTSRRESRREAEPRKESSAETEPSKEPRRRQEPVEESKEEEESIRERVRRRMQDGR
jgi:flagellar biosynthesis GTPase FlhF